MAFGLSFDELNRLYEENHRGSLRSMPFDRFFGEMDLSQEQKDKRKRTAREIQQFMLLAIMSMYNMMEEGGYDFSDASRIITQRYNDLLDELGLSLTAFFVASHVESTAAEIVSATLNHPDDPYFFSTDRARLIAENEANSIYNDAQFQDAILTGKTRKGWRAILDSRTRQTHIVANGQEIPIDLPFEVGDSLLMFPRDMSLGASPDEIVNCRCTAYYF